MIRTNPYEEGTCFLAFVQTTFVFLKHKTNSSWPIEYFLLSSTNMARNLVAHWDLGCTFHVVCWLLHVVKLSHSLASMSLNERVDDCCWRVFSWLFHSLAMNTHAKHIINIDHKQLWRYEWQYLVELKCIHDDWGHGSHFHFHWWITQPKNPYQKNFKHILKCIAHCFSKVCQFWVNFLWKCKFLDSLVRNTNFLSSHICKVGIIKSFNFSWPVPTNLSFMSLICSSTWSSLSTTPSRIQCLGYICTLLDWKSICFKNCCSS